MELGTKIFFVIYNLTFWGMCGYAFWIFIKDRKKCEVKRSREFYFGSKSTKNVLEEKRDIFPSEIIGWLIYMVLFFSSAAMFAFEPAIRKIWNGTGEMVDGLPEIMFSGIAFFSVVTVFINFTKNTGIGYDGDMLVEEYRIKRNVKIMALMIVQGYVSDFFSVLIGNITGLYPLYFGIRFLILVAFGVYIFLFIKSLWNIMDILFGEKVTNKLNCKLYKELWYSPVRKIVCEEKTIEVFKKLLQEYIEASEKINLM